MPQPPPHGGDALSRAPVTSHSNTFGLRGTSPERFCYGICGFPFLGRDLVKCERAGARAERDELPCFLSHDTPLADKGAHRSHTSAVETRIYWGLERVLLIGSLSGAEPAVCLNGGVHPNAL